MTTRLSVLLLCLATVIAVGGCGKDRSVGQPVTGDTKAGVSGMLMPKRVDGRWFIADLRIENTGTKPLHFNPTAVANQLVYFTLVAGGNTRVNAVAPDASMHMDDLPPGTATTMEMKWRHVHTPVPKNDYLWTVTVAGMTVEGEKVPDLVLTRTTP